MRLQEFIEPVQEIESIPLSAYGERGMDEELQSAMTDAKKATKWHDLWYFFNKDTLHTYSQDKKTVTGRIIFIEPGKHANTGARVLNVYVHKKHRGEGVASAMYAIMLDTFKVIRSDDLQTVGGQRMWVSLHNKPGVTVRAVLYIFPTSVTTRVEKELDKLGAVKKSQNKIGLDTYEIPVETNESMRRLITNSRMLKIYNNDNYAIGLVAYKGKARAAK